MKLKYLSNSKRYFQNIYGIENIKNMDNMSYLFAQGAKAAARIPVEEGGEFWYQFFCDLFVQYFGKDHFRYQEIENYSFSKVKK